MMNKLDLEQLTRLRFWHSATSKEMRLRCGELSAQEIRSIRAVLSAIVGDTTDPIHWARPAIVGDTSQLTSEPARNSIAIGRMEEMSTPDYRLQKVNDLIAAADYFLHAEADLVKALSLNDHQPDVVLTACISKHAATLLALRTAMDVLKSDS
jgi:hypothetical protein